MTPAAIREWANEVRNERDGNGTAETLEEIADDMERLATAVSEARRAAIEEAADICLEMWGETMAGALELPHLAGSLHAQGDALSAARERIRALLAKEPPDA